MSTTLSVSSPFPLALSRPRRLFNRTGANNHFHMFACSARRDRWRQMNTDSCTQSYKCSDTHTAGVCSRPGFGSCQSDLANQADKVVIGLPGGFLHRHTLSFSIIIQYAPYKLPQCEANSRAEMHADRHSIQKVTCAPGNTQISFSGRRNARTCFRGRVRPFTGRQRVERRLW